MRNRWRSVRDGLLIGLVGLFTIGLAPVPTLAQAGAEGAELTDRQREALALVEAGELAAQNGRWADAVENYRRAYSTLPAATILFNLSYALRALGRYRESRDCLEQLLAEHPYMPVEIQEAAQALRQEVSERVATLVVSLLENDPGVEINLDGAPVEDTGLRPLRLEVDPGERSLLISREGFLPFRWQQEVEPGAEVAIAADFLAREVAEESPSFTSRPAFWIIVGGVALAAGIVSWYFVDQSAQLEPTPGRPHIVLLSTP